MKRLFSFMLLLMVFSFNSIAATPKKLPPPNIKTFIPEKAYKVVPIIRVELDKRWSDHPQPEFLAGQGEQESCIHLRHPKCYDPSVELNTSRELGVGMFQLTKAYRPDGSVRFDALQELKDIHPELHELNWKSIYVRPDLQISAFILKNKDNYKTYSFIKDKKERLLFSTEAYNRGTGGVNTDRRICGLKKDCDPNIWFGNVELTCGASKKPIYGNNSPCDISRDYIVKIKTRSPKYKPFFE